MSIAPDGTVRPGGTPPFPLLRRIPAGEAGAPDLVTIDLAPHFWRIRLRPGRIGRAAFERLVELLAFHEPPRVAIEQDLPWAPLVDVLSEITDVVARLADLCSGPATGGGWAGFLASPQSLGRLDQPGRPHLTRAYRIWRAARGRLSREALARLLDDPIRAGSFLSRIDRSLGPVSEAFPHYGTIWGEDRMAALIGRPMRDHPDRAFAAAATEGFERAARETTPRFEVIEASITRPDGQVVHTRYDRLLLPWNSVDGRRYVTSDLFIRVERPAVLAPSPAGGTISAQAG